MYTTFFDDTKISQVVTRASAVRFMSVHSRAHPCARVCGLMWQEGLLSGKACSHLSVAVLQRSPVVRTDVILMWGMLRECGALKLVCADKQMHVDGVDAHARMQSARLARILMGPELPSYCAPSWHVAARRVNDFGFINMFLRSGLGKRSLLACLINQHN